MIDLSQLTEEQLTLLLKILKEHAEAKHCYEYDDDYSPSDAGNYGDTFDDGRSYGEIEFARELLRHIADKPEA